MKRLHALLSTMIAALLLAFVPALAQDEEVADVPTVRIKDWNHLKAEFHRQHDRSPTTYNNSSWPREPTNAEIEAAAQSLVSYFTHPGERPAFGLWTGEFLNPMRMLARYSVLDMENNRILKYHDPSGRYPAMVLLVSSARTRVAMDEGDSYEPFGAPYLIAFVLGFDESKGGWTFCYNGGPHCNGTNVGGGNHFMIGSLASADEDTLMAQFTDDMTAHGYVLGLAGSASSPDEEAAGAAVGGVVAISPSWTQPPAGFDGIGDVPGPRSAAEAAAGVAVSAAVIIFVNTLAGLPRGNAPVPGPEPVPRPPPSREEIERRARWLKDREEDLRETRERKSVLTASAAGARQAGMSTAEHDRQLADLAKIERQLVRDIGSAGGDSSYEAKVRDTVQVGAGFVEANKIAREFDRQQALAAARAKMEQLERARAQTASDYWKDVRDGFWQNTVKDVDAIPGQLKEAAKAGLRTIGETVHDAGKALADPRNWHDAAKAAMDTVRDLIRHPIDSAGKVGEFYGTVGKAAAKAAHHAATHPIETIKSLAGVDNWEKAFDPNVPVTERMARVLGGIIDMASTLAGVKEAAVAGKAALGAAIEQAGKTNISVLAGRAERNVAGKMLASERAAARAEQIGAGRYTITEAPGVKVRGSDGKLAGSRDGLVGGMTEEARRHGQLVADRYGVKLDIRPTNAASHDLIQSGQAVPKAPHCKSKTINEIDPLLGANHTDIGKAGYFKPKLPDVGTLRKLDPQTRAKVFERYKERYSEYKDQAEHIEELVHNGKVTVRDGVVFDGPTGKPYTGDHDIFDIRDATTGEPLPRYKIGPDGNVLFNADGTPMLNPVREQIIKELQQPPFNAQHGAHMDWKYDHLDRTVPPGSPDGTKSEYDIMHGIDEKVRAGHSEGPKEGPKGKPLITLVGGKEEPEPSWFSRKVKNNGVEPG